MFLERGIYRAQSIEEADFICFTGGEDVSPDLYGERPLAKTFFSAQRDMFDTAAYMRAKTRFKGEFEKPCVGICRGAQFLNVMNQGKMWQDVDWHTASHHIWDPSILKRIFVTSTHHQQMIPHADAELVAYCAISHSKERFGFSWEAVVNTQMIQADPKYYTGIQITDNPAKPVPYELDVEVLWYPATKDLCFQPHPELQGAKECREYFFSLLDKYLEM